MLEWPQDHYFRFFSHVLSYILVENISNIPCHEQKLLLSMNKLFPPPLRDRHSLNSVPKPLVEVSHLGFYFISESVFHKTRYNLYLSTILVAST